MEKNELTNTIHATLCPRAVLIAYTYEGNNNKYFLERRSIDARGRMGEGHPVTVEFMNELVRNYSETHNGTPHGRLPSNLLYADIRKGSERYVWYNPPGKRMMYFVGGLGIENAEYHLWHTAGRLRLQGRPARHGDGALCGAAFQRDRVKRLSRIGQDRKAKGTDLCEPARILGKKILADGVFPSGRTRKSDEVKPRAGD